MTELSITLVKVGGLHGSQDVIVPVRDNKLVLVGVNGIGKSTVLNIIYYFLTKQWKKLHDTMFNNLTIEINGKSNSLSKKDISDYLFVSSQLRHKLPAYVFRRLEGIRDTDMFRSFLTSSLITPALLNSMAEELDVPRNIVGDIRDQLIKADVMPTGTVSDISQFLTDEIKETLIFLPTYRRIERGLNFIVPDIEEKFRSYRKRLALNTAYLELIEFGMDDIKTLFNDTLSSIGEKERDEFNDLVGSYLSQVLHGRGEAFDYERIKKFQDVELESVISRLKDQTLKVEDRDYLRTVIQGMPALQPQSLKERDRYVALFFENIITTVKNLEQNEIGVTTLAQYCNKYLVGKKMVYRKREAAIEIRRNNDGALIELADLSSGEKQIIALFSHLCLNKDSRFIVLIDEPELSLGVEWQRTLLPDIWATKKCVFLGAVTHSPFIFDNDFDPYARDLAQLTSASAGAAEGANGTDCR